MNNHDALIEELCRSATPVRRPLPPAVRAIGVAALSLALGWLAFRSRMSLGNPVGEGDPLGFVELALAGIAGITALLCAFEMSIAGRRARGLYLAIGSFLGWLALSLFGIIRTGVPTGAFGDGLYCFSFLLIVSAPMMILAVLALRRTRAIQPGRTLFIAGLGVAALALCLLAFCHPFALQLVDFGTHLAAVACIVLLMFLFGRRYVRVSAGEH